MYFNSLISPISLVSPKFSGSKVFIVTYDVTNKMHAMSIPIERMMIRLGINMHTLGHKMPTSLFLLSPRCGKC